MAHYRRYLPPLPMPKRQADDASVCRHEAAHIVVALALGARLERVTFNASRTGARCHIQCSNLDVFARMLIFAAGAAAAPYSDHNDDQLQMCRLVSELATKPIDQTDWLRRARERAADLLRERWYELHMIDFALKQGMTDGAALTRVWRDAVRDGKVMNRPVGTTMPSGNEPDYEKKPTRKKKTTGTSDDDEADEEEIAGDDTPDDEDNELLKAEKENKAKFKPGQIVNETLDRGRVVGVVRVRADGKFYAVKPDGTMVGVFADRFVAARSF